MYCRDLEHSTEIVLSGRRRVRPLSGPDPKSHRRSRSSRRGKASRAAAGVIGVGSTVGAAITNRRVLGPAEALIMAYAATLLLLLSFVAVKWPRGITYPLAFFGTWVALALFIRAYKLHQSGDPDERGGEEKGDPPPPPAPAREGR
jgi:cardiolipin synthase